MITIGLDSSGVQSAVHGDFSASFRLVVPVDTGKPFWAVVIKAMQTACPKCKTIVRVNGSDWLILNGSCPELVGTKWEGKPEFCPLLTVVASPDVTLPGAAVRAVVQDAIDSSRVVKMSGQQS